jgi:hypothetical protein
MAWHLAVISVVQRQRRTWDGGGKGANTNAARVEAGGAAGLTMGLV